METKEESYCRLCAQIKLLDKMMNLSSETMKDIINKFQSMKIVFLDPEDSFLPQNVCFVCFENLQAALNTINYIIMAQNNLKSIFKVSSVIIGVTPIKTEDMPSGDEQKYDADEDEVIEATGFDFHDQEHPKPYLETKTKDVKEETESEQVGKLIKSEIIPKQQNTLDDLKTSWENIQWLCDSCETQFATSQELITHSMKTHGICSNFKCPFCCSSKQQLRLYKKHVVRHWPHLKLSCQQCFKTFQSTRTCNLHQKSHDKPFCCPGCNMDLKNKTDLELHLNQYNGSDKRSSSQTDVNLSCNICNKTFKRSAYYRRHLLTHKRQHICDKCGKVFSSKLNLIAHFVTHQDERPHQCKICKLSFKSIRRLRIHVHSHDTVKPFSCEACGKCFRLNSQLTNHSVLHTDVIPFTCSICSKGFKFQSIYIQHLRQHTGLRPYKCQLCNREFTNWPNYNKHMKRKHGMNMAKNTKTSEGKYPLDPVTGKVQKEDITSSIEEWRKSVFAGKKRGPRKRITTCISDNNL